MVKRRREITIETHEVWILRASSDRRQSPSSEDSESGEANLPTKLIEAISASCRRSADQVAEDETGETKHES